MGTVAEALLGEGEWLACRALLQLQMAISENDERPVETLIELNRSPNVPLLFKDDPPLVPCPADVPWKVRFEQALAPLQKGHWQVAAENLTALAGEVDDSPAIWRNLATLRGWLADRPGHVEALRKFAALEVPLEDAVEAETLAMLSSGDPLGDLVDLMNLSWTVQDAEQLQAAFRLDSRALQVPFDLSRLGSEDNPPPKAAYLLLDRPIPKTAENVSLQTVSRYLGQAMIYGRQTDREARLEVIGVSSEDLGPLRSLLAEMAGDALGPDVKETLMARVSASRELFQRKWRPPLEATPQQIESLAAEHVRDAVLNRWPQLKLGIFNGRSPREVAGDATCRVRLLAAVMILESWSERIPGVIDFNELRGQLGLPSLEPIDPQQTLLETLPLVRLSRVMVEKASDEGLLMGFRRAVAFGAMAALRKFARAVVDRPSIAGTEEQLQAYRVLAAMEEDSDRALQYIEQGRRAAESAGRSSASWDLEELSFRFARGEVHEATRLINHVQTEHMREPDVAEALMQLLVQVGVLRPDGTPAAGPPQQPPPTAAAEPGKLWTPDSQASGGEKKIWTPDST